MLNHSIAVFAATLAFPLVARADEQSPPPSRFNEATVADLQAQMAAGRLTSVDLTKFYLTRIKQLDESGPGLNSIIELNPDALALAASADAERRRGVVRGPLHGIPVLLKDNIDTGDRMQTTAGSLALAGKPATRDSTVAAKLRAGGAVILGKTNLSEWANFRSFFSTSGWSGRGGLTHNPYSLDRNACGSSSGSGAAASANFAAVSFGSETDGSIVCPANANGVVGIKPTVGLTSRAGVVPISRTQDTVGPHGRTVADAASALGVAQGFTFASADGEFLILCFDFRNDVAAYFATRVNVPVAGGTLQSAIDFNNAHAGAEMPFFNQDIFEFCNSLATGPDDPQPAFGGMTYDQALAIDHNAGVNGIDAAIAQFQLDAVVSATDNPAWATDLVFGDHFIFGTSGLAAGPGYPIVQVPASMVFGVPMGISFFGTAFSEPTLIKLASGFEAFTQVRAHNLPTFAETVPFNNIQGTTLVPPHRRAAPAATGKSRRTPHHL